MDNEYKIVNGTYYHKETPDQVIEILEGSRLSYREKRLRVHYGDTKTGKDWMEQYDIMGYVGRSMGPIKIPLLIHNKRSMGGGGMLDHCIVKITETVKPHKVLYQHPKYHTCI